MAENRKRHCDQHRKMLQKRHFGPKSRTWLVLCFIQNVLKIFIICTFLVGISRHSDDIAEIGQRHRAQYRKKLQKKNFWPKSQTVLPNYFTQKVPENLIFCTFRLGYLVTLKWWFKIANGNVISIEKYFKKGILDQKLVLCCYSILSKNVIFRTF